MLLSSFIAPSHRRASRRHGERIHNISAGPDKLQFRNSHGGGIYCKYKIIELNKSNVVATAQQGDKLKIVEKKGSWYLVETSDGKEGWIYSSLVNE